MNQKNQILRWAQFIEEIRWFMADCVEVKTPVRVPAGAFEAVIDSFSIQPGGGELQSSPEIAMKRLIAETHLSCFQICPCFRDDPEGPHHLKEFTMLEFYRVGEGLDEIMEKTLSLFKHLFGTLTVEDTSVQALFEKEVGVDLKKCDSLEDFRSVVCEENLVRVTEEDTWEDIFFKVMLEKIEPKFKPDTLTFVHHYPKRLAALSKLNEKGEAERFEIYWKGMELCNGAAELTDLGELKARIEKEKEARVKTGKKPHPNPSQLIEALELGLPECAGVAVGLNRVFQIYLDPDNRHPNIRK